MEEFSCAPSCKASTLQEAQEMRVRVSMRAHSARQEILSGFVMNDGQSAVLDGSNNLSEVRLLRARRDEPGGPKQARPPPFV